MVFIKNTFVFHTQANQLVDCEEPPIVDQLLRPFPMCKYIMLIAKQRQHFLRITIETINNLQDGITFLSGDNVDPFCLKFFPCCKMGISGPAVNKLLPLLSKFFCSDRSYNRE